MLLDALRHPRPVVLFRELERRDAEADGVRLRAVAQQQPHDLVVAGEHGRVQQRPAAARGAVRVAAGGEHQAHVRRLSGHDGPVEHRRARAVAGVDVGAAVEQQPGDALVAALDGDEQDRLAVAVARVDGEAAVEPRRQEVAVAVVHGPATQAGTVLGHRAALEVGREERVKAAVRLAQRVAVADPRHVSEDLDEELVRQREQRRRLAPALLLRVRGQAPGCAPEPGHPVAADSG